MANELLNHRFPPDLTGIWTEQFALQLAATQGALSGLNEAVSLLHNPNLLMRPLLGKEAESSSRLEGTQASVEDVYKAELRDAADQTDDVQEVMNYQRAMLLGVDTLKDRALTQSVIREIHKQLMQGVRGQDKKPGQYRKGNVWIGQRGTGLDKARYVPPDAIHIPSLMKMVEDFINKGGVHPLITCGIIHHRFEAIHPFEDGNGRTGRLVITLYLLKSGMLAKPMLYPSGYFEKRRDEYMDALHKVDISQSWDFWLMFFLKGIEQQAVLSLEVASEIDGLYKQYRAGIRDTQAHLGLLNLLELCFVQPYLTVQFASTRLGIPANTVRRYITTLEEKGVLRLAYLAEHGEKVYTNDGLLAILRRI